MGHPQHTQHSLAMPLMLELKYEYFLATWPGRIKLVELVRNMLDVMVGNFCKLVIGGRVHDLTNTLTSKSVVKQLWNEGTVHFCNVGCLNHNILIQGYLTYLWPTSTSS